MFSKSFTLLVASLATVIAVEVRHLELQNAHLIDTSDTHYAITAPTFKQVNWKTATVNVNNIFIMTPECEMIFKQLDQASDLEKALLDTTRALISSLETDRPKVAAGETNYSESKFGDKSRLVSGNGRMVEFESKGYYISKFDNDNFTASKKNFPNQWMRIFVTTESVTFIYRNGGLLMKPINCLMTNEQKIIDEMKELVKKGPPKCKPRNDKQNNNNRRAKATNGGKRARTTNVKRRARTTKVKRRGFKDMVQYALNTVSLYGE